jgi:hypothetical protein
MPQTEWLDVAALAPKQTVLIAIVREVQRACAVEGLVCWITGGTLLGAVRHKGFIPHDDDADLECAAADWPQVVACLPAGLEGRLGGLWRGERIGSIVHTASGVDVDVFFRDEEMAPSGDFPGRDEVFPLRPYAFHGAKLLGPGKPEGFLERCYGADWAGTVRVWTHSFNWQLSKGFDPGRVILCLEEYAALMEESGYIPPSGNPSLGEPEVERAIRVLCDLRAREDAARRANGGISEELRRRNCEEAEALERIRAARARGA